MRVLRVPTVGDSTRHEVLGTARVRTNRGNNAKVNRLEKYHTNT